MYLIYLIKLILLQVFINLVECDKPLLQEILVPRNLNENQTIKLNCDLISGKQPITLEWYFNNEKIIENDSRIKLKVNEDSASLIIRELSVDDIGDYYCLATNQFGDQDKRFASVYVNSKPKWTIEPKNITSSLNKDVLLQCDVKSYPQSVINWIKLSSNKETPIKEFNTNSIKFNLNKQTSGYYKCIATNQISSIEKIIHVGYFSKYSLLKE